MQRQRKRWGQVHKRHLDSYPVIVSIGLRLSMVNMYIPDSSSSHAPQSLSNSRSDCLSAGARFPFENVVELYRCQSIG